MQIGIYAAEEEQHILKKTTMDYCTKYNYYPILDLLKNKETLMDAMRSNEYAIVIIAVDKAKGFEVVKYVRKLNSNSKIIWFSDDKDFAGSAFEYGVSYFALRPITREKIEEGIMLCGISGELSNLCRVHLKADSD